MNFYSDDIINNIIDHTELENIIPEMESFKNLSRFLLTKYSFHDVHYDYIEGLLNDENNKMAFYCLDLEFSLFNSPTMMIYHKYNDKNNNEIKYYILMICTAKKFRNQGYASKLLDGFIERVKNEHIKNESSKNKTIKIILSSIESALLFYESYGFKWKCESLTDHKILMNYESYEEDKEYFILELIVK